MPRSTSLPPFSLSQAVAMTFVYGILFGFYLVTAAFANRWLIFADEGWKLRKNHHCFMIAITNVLAIFVVTAVALATVKSMDEASFVEQGGRLSDWVYPAWNAITACTLADLVALLADIVLIYRVWIVHAKQMWVTWFPIFLWVGGLVCTILQLFLQVVHIHNPNFGPYQWAEVNMNVGPGIVLTPFWASTIVLNGYCTGMSVWKIWSTLGRGENSTTSKQLQFIVRILMESGVLYLCINLAHFFVWFGHDDFPIQILGTANTIVIGIAYNLVIIRTAQKRAESEDTYHNTEKITELVFHSATSVEYTSSVERDEPTRMSLSMPYRSHSRKCVET